MPARVDYTKYADSDLSILTIRERETLILKMQGLSTVEISKKFNCCRQNINALLIKARKKLDDPQANPIYIVGKILTIPNMQTVTYLY